MALSEGLLRAVRSWVGTGVPPTDLELDAAYDFLGTAKAVVLEILRQRHIAFVNTAAQFSVAGKISRGTGENITALERLMAQLANAPDDLGFDQDTGLFVTPGTIRVQSMRRTGHRR